MTGFRYCLLAVAACVFSGGLFADDHTQAIPLFYIGKNTNRNQVHYEAILTKDCRFAETEPIHAYWQRLEKESDAVRELKWAEEKFAYGVKVIRKSDHHLIFIIAADDSRPVIVETRIGASGCEVAARTQILNAWVKPGHAFVELKERRALYPKVFHVDLIGESDDGNAVCERVISPGKMGVPCPH